MLHHLQHNHYLIRRKVFKLAGGAFHIYDADGNLVLYSKQKAFKLKEDIRLYSDESMTEELLWIQARNVIDISATYDVFDSTTDQKVGSLRRQGLRSIVRDTWLIFDAEEHEVGNIEEDNILLSILRRFLGGFIPQHYSGELVGNEFCEYKQQFNPFVYKLGIDFPAEADAFNRIMGLAGGILLTAIEGRQE